MKIFSSYVPCMMCVLFVCKFGYNNIQNKNKLYVRGFLHVLNRVKTLVKTNCIKNVSLLMYQF